MSASQERVIKSIANALGIGPDDIKPENTFIEIGADSLDLVEMHMSVEDEFEIEIQDKYIPLINDTVQAYIDSIKSYTE